MALAELADVLRRERLSAGLSQRELASRAGITTRYVEYLEAAQRHPRQSALHVLALAIDPDRAAEIEGRLVTAARRARPALVRGRHDPERPARTPAPSGTRVMDNGTSSAVSPLGGVFPASFNALQAVAPASGLSVNVNAGYCSVPSPSAGGGTYVFGQMSSGNLAIAGNSSGHTRIDLVVARVYDLASSSSFCDIEIVQGTPNAGQPATPSTAILLATVTVASGASSITAGNIADKPFVVPPGCILPTAAGLTLGGLNGAPQIIYNESAGVLQVAVSGGVNLVSPSIPVMSVVNTTSQNGLTPGIEETRTRHWTSAGASAAGTMGRPDYRGRRGH